MKRFFTIAAFFWACTFTQQARYMDSCRDMKNEWPQYLLASELKSEPPRFDPSFFPNPGTWTNKKLNTKTD